MSLRHRRQRWFLRRSQGQADFGYPLRKRGAIGCGHAVADGSGCGCSRVSTRHPPRFGRIREVPRIGILNGENAPEACDEPAVWPRMQVASSRLGAWTRRPCLARALVEGVAEPGRRRTCPRDRTRGSVWRGERTGGRFHCDPPGRSSRPDRRRSEWLAADRRCRGSRP